MTRTDHNGAPGAAHGGIMAALLDEASGQAALLIVTPAVTARLDEPPAGA